MPRCPQHTTAWSATGQVFASNTWSDAVSIRECGITKEGQQVGPRAAEPALPHDLSLNTPNKMGEPTKTDGDGVPEIRSSELASDEDNEEEENLDELEKEAIEIANKVVTDLYKSNAVSELDLLARGGYHYVWLVTHSKRDSGAEPGKEQPFVLRISRNTPSLQPYQVLHEVACLEYLQKNVTSIPTPKVYAWGVASPESCRSFIAEEFIDGERLSVAWPRLTSEQKTNITHEVANVIVALGETRFAFIGGLSIHGSAGPTLEAAKVLNGRAKFHCPDCYDIGPYNNIKDYILACYDREIYYYTHANESEIVEGGLEATSIVDFVTKLRAKRESLRQDDAIFRAIDAEPLVLVHEDFHAGNLLVRDGHLVGVVDWEFSGVYPLSELLGPIAILQVSEAWRDDLTEEEEEKWHARYRREVERVVRKRGWRDEDIKTVMGGGHQVLQTARSIMFPEYEEDVLEEQKPRRLH